MNSRTITPEWLREQRPASGVIPLSAEVGAMLADAIEIADDDARAWIEAVSANDWCDLTALESYEQQSATIYVRYLEARGLLERHPERPHLVRVLDEASAQA